MQAVLSDKFIAVGRSFELQVPFLLVMLAADAICGFRQWQWR